MTTKSSGDSLRDEIDRQLDLVPAMGTRWRWYEFLYRPLTWILRNWTRFRPPLAEASINRAINRLRLFNDLEREKIAYPVHPLFNIVLPQNEKIEYPCFWVAEFFSPSYAEVLRKQFAPGGLLAGKPFDSLETAEAQIKLAREGQRHGGMSHLATWIRADTKGYAPRAIRASLPDGIRAIALIMYPMGSALTAFVASFQLTKEAQCALDDVLRMEHVPQLHKIDGKKRIQQRHEVGIEAVQRERERIHQLGRDWLSQQLPGVFGWAPVSSPASMR